MKKYDYAIVGSGMSGSIFAYEMAKRGKKCIVIEKKGHIGGACYSEKIHGIEVHKYGAHIFRTNDKEIMDYLSGIVKMVPYVHQPIAKKGKKVYSLPFNMHTFAEIYGMTDPAEVAKFLDEQKCSTCNNLEEFAISSVGVQMYEELIKEYTEKQWGVPCTELPVCTMRTIPIRLTYDNNYFREKYQAIPEEGYGNLFEVLLKDVDLALNTDAADVRLDKLADRVFYTGRIDDYFYDCFGELDFRSVTFEHKYISDADNVLGAAVVNYVGKDVPYTRAIEHKHFAYSEPSQVQGTVLSYEYPRKYERGVTEPLYPIEDEKNFELLEKYKAIAAKQNLTIFGGKLGCYRYDNMATSIKETLKIVNEEVGNG